MTIVQRPLNTPNFWTGLSVPTGYDTHGLYFKDRDAFVIVLSMYVDVQVVHRDREEYFTRTMTRAAQQDGYIVGINGPFFDLTGAGIADVMTGHDPVSPEDTMDVGRVRQNNATLGGRASPLGFHLVQNHDASIVAGPGDPPPRVRAGIGGLTPIIVAGRTYNSTNVYSGRHRGPATGEPPADLRPHLRYRSNGQFADTAARPASTGKTVVAKCSAQRALLIVSQEDGVADGISFIYIRNALAAMGCDMAVGLDGSDSALLWSSPGQFLVRSGQDKDEGMKTGLAFRPQPRPPQPQSPPPQPPPRPAGHA